MSPEYEILVIGGGPAGLEAALMAGRAGCRTLLVEKHAELGGLPRGFGGSFPNWEDPRAGVTRKIQEIKSRGEIGIMTGTDAVSLKRAGRFYNCDLQARDGVRTANVPAVILATGFGLIDCSRYGEYGYGIYPGVVNSLDFEGLLESWMGGGGPPPPESVGFIQCVGSRDRAKGFPYCSKICCMYTARQAGTFRDLFPGSRCCVFYIDIRAAGKGYEEFVRSVIEDRKVRYIRGRPGKVLPANGRLLIRSEDTLMGVPVEIEADMVVLAPAVVPGPETARLAQTLGIAADRYGFPEDGAGLPEGVFIAGGCGFAVSMAEAASQGAAAAAAAIAYVRNF